MNNAAHLRPVSGLPCSAPQLDYGAYGPDTRRFCETCFGIFDIASGKPMAVSCASRPGPSAEEKAHVESLRNILVDFLKKDFTANGHSRQGSWRLGMEHGKAFFGNAVLGALEDSGCDRRGELQRAMDEAGIRSP